jgi:uncharacterized protein
MSSLSLISQKPLLLGLKHFGLGILGIGAVSGIGAGTIEIAGNKDEIGPKIEIAVPKYVASQSHDTHAPATEVTNNIPLAPGLIGMMGFKLADGGMSVWDKSQDLQSHEADPHNAQTNDVHVTTPAEAASADPHAQAGHIAGEVKITTNMGQSNTITQMEGGVKVIRGNVQGGGSPLVAAPISGVQTSGPHGMLPTIAADGRTAFDVYRRPFTNSGSKVALIVGGLGLNARITERAINQLPAEITLSFVPNSENLQAWVNKARAQGHEVMIEIPMEPFDYPDNDPGPQTLMSTGDWGENARKLDYILSRTTGYFAVTNYLGGRFAGSANSANFMKSMKSRGIGFISDGSAPALVAGAKSSGVKSASADRNIDIRPAAPDIMAQLGALEASAKQKGQAMGFGIGYSVTIDQIINWIGDARTRGIILAPASALAS